MPLFSVPALAPVFPYIDIAPLQWGPIAIQPFGLMVAIAIFVGMYFVQRRGQYLGLNPARVAELVTVCLLAIFIGSHLFSVFFYQPERIREDPWVILRIWDGIASFGGAIGLVATAVWFAMRNRLPFLVASDILWWGGVHAWIFGRLGCSIAHDHPGFFTSSWFSVRWPLNHPDQILNVHQLPGRHDLGLYEFLYTFIMLGLMYLADRKWEYKPGITTAVVFIAYAPIRFVLDFLREGDLRYLGLTPAQYGSLLMLAGGILLLARVMRSGTPWQPPPMEKTEPIVDEGNNVS